MRGFEPLRSAYDYLISRLMQAASGMRLYPLIRRSFRHMTIWAKVPQLKNTYVELFHSFLYECPFGMVLCLKENPYTLLV